MTIKIQDDYWTGTECLDNEVPWIVPGAVYKLDEMCHPEDSVIDVGSGGSTLFYAKRCRRVVAVETNADWFRTVDEELRKRGISNVDYHFIPDQGVLVEFLKQLEPAEIISVDSVHSYDRSLFLDTLLAKDKKPDIVVLDNYGSQVLFPRHYDMSGRELAHVLPPHDWFVEDYNDPHWVGTGTRLLHREH